MIVILKVEVEKYLYFGSTVFKDYLLSFFCTWSIVDNGWPNINQDETNIKLERYL